jgi:hypothetical protein
MIQVIGLGATVLAGVADTALPRLPAQRRHLSERTRETLPKDVDELREAALRLVAERDLLFELTTRLQQIIDKMKRLQFGKRSEKLNPDQLQLGLEDLEQAAVVAHIRNVLSGPVKGHEGIEFENRSARSSRRLGWIPQDAKLTPRADTMPSWDSIPEAERPFQRRLMEVFAGFVEHTDAQVGRLVDGIEQLGLRDNTIIFYMFGDNGSNAEGQNGTISELLAQNMIPNTIAQQLAALEKIGGLDALGSAKTDNMYHAGWAWAGDKPFPHTKLVASHFGGTRNPLVIPGQRGSSLTRPQDPSSITSTTSRQRFMRSWASNRLRGGQRVQARSYRWGQHGLFIC